jgi:hypothetical protein
MRALIPLAAAAVAAAAPGCRGPEPIERSTANEPVARRGDAAPVDASASQRPLPPHTGGAESGTADTAAWRHLLEECAQRGDYEELLALAERWTREAPGQAQAWLALAQWLIDPELPAELGDRAAALAAAERAHATSAAPDAEALVTLGTARYLNDDRRGALEAYRAALAQTTEPDARRELQDWVAELEADEQRAAAQGRDD